MVGPTGRRMRSLRLDAIPIVLPVVVAIWRLSTAKGLWKMGSNREADRRNGQRGGSDQWITGRRCQIKGWKE